MGFVMQDKLQKSPPVADKPARRGVL